MFDFGCLRWVQKFPSLPNGFRVLLLATRMSFLSSVTLTYVINVRFETARWLLEFQVECAKHVSVFEAMAMYEHLLNLDSVFRPIFSFCLEVMLFRITLSHEGVCLGDVFAGRVSSLVRWCERYFVRHQ